MSADYLRNTHGFEDENGECLMPIQDETIQKFQDLFACTKGFQAVPLTNTPDENGKIRYKYKAFQGPIKTQHYRNHFNTKPLD